MTTSTGAEISVARYAVVGRGDRISRDGHGFYVPLLNGKARITPAYSVRAETVLGGKRVSITLKEVTARAELDAYRRLTDLHYRGDRTFGRRTVLVATTSSVHLPPILGYVEVTTGFLMNRPRTRVLDAPFTDGKVSWSRWSTEEMRDRTSAIARISRLVVHPDVRGQGLGKLLLRAARPFARKRFHAGGMRPAFLEMTADMAKFVPFARQAGMYYVGHTQGNLHRVAADARYLLSRSDLLRMPTKALRARGIMQAQRGYATALRSVADARGEAEVAEAIAALRQAVDGDSYALLHGVLRLPKPTYLCGLTTGATRFLEERVATLRVRDPPQLSRARIEPIDAPIVLADVTVCYSSSVARTRRSTQIQEAFGIRPEHFTSTVIEGMSISLPVRSVTLITGPSGAGKTSLLRLIDRDRSEGLVAGTVSLPANAVVGKFMDLPGDEPLIEVLARDADVSDALYALAHAGLSDAKLYLRRYAELSNGQKYRAILAALIASEANVWVADEFLATLDRVTASAVAARAARHARHLGVTVIVAAPHFDYFLQELNPDLVLQLQSPAMHQLYGGREFMRRWRHS